MTWAAAIADVHGQLTGLESATVKVYDHEPGNPGWHRPQAVVVSLGALYPTEYGVTIRVYQTTNIDVHTAQTDLTLLVSAVDAALDDTTPRSTWQTVWLADENAWSCSTEVQFPREDF